MPSRREKKVVQPKRGDRITFVKGAYEGEKGWLNDAKTPTSTSVHVIIDGGQSVAEDAEFTACVRKASVMPEAKTAETLEEFVVQEDTKVAGSLIAFAQAYAEAGMEKCTVKILEIVKVQIDLAIAIQKQKGKKAKYSATALKVKDKKHQLKKRRSSGTGDAVMDT